MNIVEFIKQDKTYQKYADKFTNPIRKFVGNVPERIHTPFIKQATIEEIADYYMGFLNRKYSDIPSILSGLERYGIIEIPVTEGILTQEFWKQYSLNDGYTRIMELTLI